MCAMGTSPHSARTPSHATNLHTGWQTRVSTKSHTISELLFLSDGIGLDQASDYNPTHSYTLKRDISQCYPSPLQS
jgi:hypothetical protein